MSLFFPRGGSFSYYGEWLLVSHRTGAYYVIEPTTEDVSFGFRVASEVPEPGSIALVAVAGLCLLAYGQQRR